jgi:hybrid cluster-associated redox disulfide protein
LRKFRSVAPRGKAEQGCVSTTFVAGSPRIIAGMMEAATIGLDDIVDEVMRWQPATIRIFLDFKFGCVGCPIAAFHSVADACREHGVAREAFLAALCAGI